VAAAEALLVIAQAGFIAACLHRSIVDRQALDALWPMLIALLVVFALRALVHAARGTISARGSSSVRSNLRRALYTSLSNAAPSRRADLDTGSLASRLVDQIEVIDAYFAQFLPQRSSALVVPLAIVIAVFSQNWLAGVLLAITAPVIPLFMALVGMGAEAQSRRQQQALARLGGLFHDRLRGLDTLRRFRGEQREQRRLAQFSDELRARTMRVLRLAFLSSAVLEFFAAVAIASLAIYIGFALLGFIDFGPAASLTLGSGLFILLLAPEFFAPLRTLAQSWHARADALAAAADLRPLLALPPARPESVADAGPLPRAACSIGVEGLDFTWPGRDRVLGDLDFAAAPGEHVLIAGPSGSGKSTLIRLLAGFERPDRGRIRFGELDAGALGLSELARLRAWLGQRPVLFPGTIAGNIDFGRSLNRDRLEQACDLAGVSEFCRDLPLGLDTEIGQDGFGFSGGQAQRIALARALAEPCPVLLLDEPTAALDEDNEQLVWDAIEQATRQRNMTVVCASHSRLARSWADRTLHLERGRLTEEH
jgi:ATP-binding cassette subfamily C protein CydD